MLPLKAPYSIFADIVLYPINVLHISVVKAKFKEDSELLVSMLRSSFLWHHQKK